MSNPLYTRYNQNPLLDRFNQFKQNFSGDARQQVQNLLNSGKVTQEQYNRAVQMANQMMKLIK